MVKIHGIVFEGNNVVITDEGVFIDGKQAQDLPKTISTLKVEIIGNPTNIVARGAVTIHGDVQGYVDAGGSVNCGNIAGDVNSEGSVHCGNVRGNIDAGGSVRCTGKSN